ncbi:hypothetical protein LTR95_016275, partial [Oleoguttula sp. CCFEE 5521]
LEDWVHGLLLLGAGRRSRKRLDRHYSANSYVVKAEVMYEVVVTLPPSEPNGHVERRLEQRTTIAEVYVWSDEAARVRPTPVNAASWTLHDFLDGKYDDIAVFQDGVLPGWHFNGMREEGGYEVMEATTETSKRAEVEMGSDVGEERRDGAVDVARMGWFV